jgi:hypothetical protein
MKPARSLGAIIQHPKLPISKVDVRMVSFVRLTYTASQRRRTLLESAAAVGERPELELSAAAVGLEHLLRQQHLNRGSRSAVGPHRKGCR